MKKLSVFFLLALLLALTATPAFAQGGARIGDSVCFAGSVVVTPNDAPRDVVLFGCGARIQTGARVASDIVSFGGEVVIEKGARVEQAVVVFGAPLIVAGEVGRDIASFGGAVTLDSTAVVGGNIAAFGGRVEKREGATVRGQITRNDRPSGATFRFAPIWFGAPVGSNGGDFAELALWGLFRGVMGALALAALGALTVVFFPNQTQLVGDVAEKSALVSFGAGCVTLLAAPTLILLLVILICTIPVAAVLAFVFALAGVFGWIAIGRVVGERILQAIKAKETLRVPMVAVILGVFVLALVSVAPIVGWLVGFVAGVLGIGAVVLTRFGTRAYPAPVPAAPSALSATLPPPPSTP